MEINFESFLKENKSQINKYNIWKTDSKGEPIENSDRILTGPSLRWIMRQIAYENDVTITPGGLVVRLENGDMFVGQKI